MRRARAAAVFVVLISLVGCGEVSSTANPTTSAQPSPTVSAQPTTTPEAPPWTLPPTSPTPAATAAPSASTSTAPSPDASPTPTATPAQHVSHEGLIVDWNRAADPGFGFVYQFKGVAENGGTYVAVGEATWDMQAGIWVSNDGLRWSWASFPKAHTEDATLEAVAADVDGFVAVGSVRRYVSDGGFSFDGAVFVSPDGASWELIETDQFRDDTLRDVFSINGTVVAVGWETMYVSRDGRTWRQSLDPSALVVGQGMDKVISDGAMLWAFSRTEAPRERDQTLEVWTSTDGMTWQLAAALPHSRGRMVEAAAVGPAGIIAVGNDSQVWYSFDGAAWRLASQPPHDIWGGDVLADRAGFIATGRYVTSSGCVYSEEQIVGVTWTSVDGNIWRPMPEKGFKGKLVQALALSGRTLIGLGADYNLSNEDDAVAWTSELPDMALDQNPPAPSPTSEPNSGCGDLRAPR